MNDYLVSYGLITGRGGKRILRQDVITASTYDGAINKAYAMRERDSVLFIELINIPPTE